MAEDLEACILELKGTYIRAIVSMVFSCRHIICHDHLGTQSDGWWDRHSVLVGAELPRWRRCHVCISARPDLG